MCALGATRVRWVQAYQIPFQVFNLGVPEKNDKCTYNVPGTQNILWHDIINQERHYLCKAFVMLSD